MKKKEKIIRYCISIVSIIGLTVCISILFPQVRQMVIRLAEQVLRTKISLSEDWMKGLLSYAMGGIFFIILFDYCTLTSSGKTLVRTVMHEIRDCLFETDWRSFTKPAMIMSVIYLLGILTIIRSNVLYLDDIGRTAKGFRTFYPFSRYISEILSVFIHADYRLTDISPFPQLLAIIILAAGSILLVYILNDNKITTPGLLASIPLGLSPYMMECLSYRFDAPYMALSVLASIVPFLFLSRKKAFAFCSVISLLIMCMTYQAASGIYILIALILSFNDWNRKRKTNKEVFLFLARAILSFCTAMFVFKLFLMKPFSAYASNSMLPLPQMISGILTNIKTYVYIINDDFGFIWKTLVGTIICFFIAKSVKISAQKKMISFLVIIFLLFSLFILSFGIYLILEHPLFAPRALYGFGLLLAIVSIYVASEFNKTAKIFAFALSWSFWVFAFSYGNALADQMRYANFRITILLHDLSALFPDKDENKLSLQLDNSIGFTPAVKNIAKHNPVIYKLVPPMLLENDSWSNVYFLDYYNFSSSIDVNFKVNREDERQYNDFNTLDLPVILKTYYHTIKSDGKRVLVELNDDYK